MAAIQPNMDFMVEESYPCKGDGCDKVFYVKADLKKQTKDHKKEIRERKHCCLHCNKNISRVQNLKLHQQTCEQNENRIAGSTVLMLMNPMAVFNSLSQH